MRSRGCIWVCAAALVLACGLAAAQVAPPGSKLKPSDVALLPDGTLRVQYTLEVTLFWGAPSCFARPIILTSGIFEPEIVINQRDVLAVSSVLTGSVSHGCHPPFLSAALCEGPCLLYRYDSKQFFF